MNYDYCINTITWTPKLKILTTTLSIRMLNSLHVNKYTTSFAIHITNPLQNIYTYRSPIYIYHCKTSIHTVQKSHFPMSMRNWMLPHFPDNYRTKRDSDEREYYAGLQREWDFRVNESNALHDDLVQLEAPFVNRVSLTLSWKNMHQYECVVTKKKKKKRTI